MHAKLRISGTLLLTVVGLAGCNRITEPMSDPRSHGRYAGIGIYGPGESWKRMVAARQTKASPAAKTIDDQAIVVVIDSTTGEVRSCGDMTGYCIGMAPWKTPLARSQIAPIDLTEHVKPIEAESAASAVSEAPAASR